MSLVFAMSSGEFVRHICVESCKMLSL